MSSSAGKVTDRPQPLHWPPRFSLSQAFLGMTVLAVCCVFYRFYVYLPLWLVIPYGGMIAASSMARRKVSPDFCWGVFTVAWCIVLWDICESQTRCFMSMGPFDGVEASQCLIFLYLTGVAMPAVFSVWSIPTLLRASLGSRSSSRKWLYLTLYVANLDVAICTTGMAYLVHDHLRF